MELGTSTADIQPTGIYRMMHATQSNSATECMSVLQTDKAAYKDNTIAIYGKLSQCLVAKWQ